MNHFRGYCRVIVSYLVLLVFAILATAPGLKALDLCIPTEAKKATVYVPVYSHIYHGDQLRSFNLAVTISLRNTDSAKPVTVNEAKYFDANGNSIRDLLISPIVLLPLHTSNIKIKESDVQGGSGGSVSVKWSSEGPVSPLLVESVMIGTMSGQGISFTSRGQITSFDR